MRTWCRWLLVLSCCLGLHLKEARGGTKTAQDLFSACQDIMQVGPVDNIPSNFDTGFCWGVFSTVYHNLFLLRSQQDQTPVLNICAPLTPMHKYQLIAIFDSYLRRNPQRLHEDYRFVVQAALYEAWPCPKG
jgi:Rap1a immunity proteins